LVIGKVRRDRLPTTKTFFLLLEIGWWLFAAQGDLCSGSHRPIEKRKKKGGFETAP